MYVAYATGGLWRTDDWGLTWAPLFDGESSFGIGDFQMARDGETLWVGTGESNSQRTSYAGTGVFKSTDGGKNWSNMGLNDTHHIGKVAISPKNENVVFVGAIGHLYTANNERGVFRTTDGGKTWQHVLKLNDLTGCIDLVMDPRNPDVLYAAMWERERRAWDFRDFGPGTGIYKTTDGGVSWKKLSNGLPGGELGRIGLSLCQSKPDTVYAFVDNFNPDADWIFEDEFAPSKTLTLRRFLLLTEDQLNEVDREQMTRFLGPLLPPGTKPEEVLDKLKAKQLALKELYELMEKRNPNVFQVDYKEHEIYRSDDAGRSWKRTHTYKFGNHGGYYWGKIRVNPSDPEDIWTTGVLLLRSKNGGATWERTAQGVHVDFHEVWIDPAKSGRVAVGCDGGLYISGDDGKTFRHVNNVSVGQFTTIAVDNKVPYTIFGGHQDNGTRRGPSTYTPGRSPIHLWTAIGGGDGSWVAVDPRDGGATVYNASQNGAHSAQNQKTAERWNTRASARAGDPALRYNWVSPLIISTFHPDIVYLGSQKVHRSFNQGRNWSEISPDITKNLPNGDVPFSTIKVLDESPLRFGLLYAGTDDGKVVLTRDGGVSWKEISTPVPEKWVSRVIASKWDEGTVYVTQSGYRDDDYRPYVWKSTDFGATWTSISSNLPFEFVNVIREDPTRKEMLYVGTGMGVFVTFDGGGVWEPLHSGLPRNPVHDLVIHSREMDVVAGTHGRSVWVLNAKPLQQLTTEIRAKDLHIFPIADMRREPTWQFRRRQAWDASPEAWPAVRGKIWTRAAGPASARIKDSAGKVVKELAFEALRGFNDFSIELVLDPGRKGAVDPKMRDPKTVEEKLADPFAQERPRFLEAGSYTIEVTVGGKSATQAWKLT